ncbi:MAG: hypothetical protein OXN89_05970, partial [Bryobacterales bacterium]|nr:hypothetical protein [Bryobacterales bacterium]
SRLLARLPSTATARSNVYWQVTVLGRPFSAGKRTQVPLALGIHLPRQPRARATSGICRTNSRDKPVENAG